MESINMPNIEPIIHNFLQGKSTPDEDKILYLWVKENPENRKTLFQEKDFWEASRLGTQKLNEAEFNHWFELQDKIIQQNKKVNRLKEVLRTAAIVILSLGAGWLGHSLVSSGVFANKQIEMKQVESFNGQLKEIFLADGTHVWLNSGSKLSFPSGFNAENREVELSGEAFFEVTANEEEPFLVKTQDHIVKVTGTRFNISEYPESNIIETTLEEGRVKIITGNFIKDLYPGQQSSFNTRTAEIRIGETDLEVYTTWKDGFYEFNNESVCKVFKIIERWWDVKIDYPEKDLKDERITGTLRRHKPLDQHFDVIKRLVPFNYKIESDLVTVSLK
ncbi:FecR family protein [Mariniphaga sp.]|uniref:FecR family protein n=1 Tax=Mariniphaga sp. TaxID=1954475 RepID=UPI003566DAD3